MKVTGLGRKKEKSRKLNACSHVKSPRVRWHQGQHGLQTKGSRDSLRRWLLVLETHVVIMPYRSGRCGGISFIRGQDGSEPGRSSSFSANYVLHIHEFQPDQLFAETPDALLFVVIHTSASGSQCPLAGRTAFPACCALGTYVHYAFDRVHTYIGRFTNARGPRRARTDPRMYICVYVMPRAEMETSEAVNVNDWRHV